MAVGPSGQVVGIDRDQELLELARRDHHRYSNLQFEWGDVTKLNYLAQFDVVTAARTLQWIPESNVALLEMKKATKPAGTIVILDYSHSKNEWEPSPPPEFRDFYEAFLAWRQANGWNNEIADRLPEMFQSAGLADVRSYPQDEVVERGQPEFAERSALWLEAIENVGEQIFKAGFALNLTCR